MVGLIHRMLLELLDELLDAAAVARIRARANIPADTMFRMAQSYSDEEFRNLLTCIMEETGLDRDTLEIRFASHFLKDAKARWPRWFDMSTSARELLLRQPKIHNGFASSMCSEADRTRINDKFLVDEDEQGITVHYKSPNQLCVLYKALAKEVIDDYGEQATITESLCLKKGDAKCCIRVEWPAPQ